MDVYLDNELVKTDKSTLGEILDTMRDKLAPDGRIVVEVRVDGVTLGGGELDSRRDEDIDCQELQLITADPYELTMQTLGDVKSVLNDALGLQKKAAGLLRADTAGEALDSVRDALAIWTQVQQSVSNSAAMVDVSLDELMVNDRAASKIVRELADLLGELREQLTSNDWIGLADTLEYPFTEAVDVWRELIDVLRSSIEKGR